MAIYGGFAPIVDEQFADHGPDWMQTFLGEHLDHRDWDLGGWAVDFPRLAHRLWHDTLHPKR